MKEKLSSDNPTSEAQIADSTVSSASLAVTLLSAAAFMVTADARVVSPLLRVIADEFKSDIGITGLIVTFYTIPYGLFQLVYGPLADRFGKLKVVTLALLFFSIGTALCGLAPDLLSLNLLRLLTGIVAAAIIPSTLAYIGDTFAYGVRQLAIGRFLGAVALGNLLSTGLGGIIAEFLSWRYIFVLYGLASLLITLLLWRSLGSTPDQHNPDGPLGLKAIKPYWQLMRQGSVWIVIGAVFIEGFFFFGSFSFFGSFLRDHYNLSYIYVGLILSGFGLGSLIYSRLVRRLLALLGESGLLRWGGTVLALALVGVVMVQLWAVFIGMVIVAGVGYYMMHSTLQTRATELAPERRSTGVSLFAFMLFLGQGTGTALLGMLIDSGASYEPAFLLSAAGLGGLGWGFVAFDQQRQRRTAKL